MLVSPPRARRPHKNRTDNRKTSAHKNPASESTGGKKRWTDKEPRNEYRTKQGQAETPRQGPTTDRTKGPNGKAPKRSNQAPAKPLKVNSRERTNPKGENRRIARTSKAAHSAKAKPNHKKRKKTENTHKPTKNTQPAPGDGRRNP